MQPYEKFLKENAIIKDPVLRMGNLNCAYINGILNELLRPESDFGGSDKQVSLVVASLENVAIGLARILHTETRDLLRALIAGTDDESVAMYDLANAATRRES